MQEDSVLENAKSLSFEDDAQANFFSWCVTCLFLKIYED
jgi:hypothetical protein